MIEKFVKGKVAVSIDAANTIYACKTLGWKISFKKLAKYLRKNCDIFNLNFYNAVMGKHEGEKKFISILKEHGYHVVTKRVKRIKQENGTVILKGDIDVELALDAIIQADHFNTIILFSGDSDFEELLRRLKKIGKRVLVVSTKKHISRELIQVAHKYINLKKLKNEIALQK
jgi:uncharacterized protein (TIGR00288 family)